MIKVVRPRAWDFDAPILSRVKYSSRGLIGADRLELVKMASVSFAEAVKRAELHRDEVPVHLIAMGATEYYGPNRNGDGFREGPLKEYFRNFVKYAKPFRDHKNASTDPHYGRVIDAVYNDAMHRVDLLVGYNDGPESLRKNGGLRADLEVADIEAGREFPVSMATLVPYDVCSSCQHRAKRAEDYCKGASCPHGGLADHIGEVFADGHHLHADNPANLRFIDISRVRRPADRTAYSLGKVASAIHQCGAKLAEDYGLIAPPLAEDLVFLSEQGKSRTKCAYMFAELERARQISDVDLVSMAAIRELPGVPAGADPRQIWGALSQCKAAATLSEFFTSIVGNAEIAKTAALAVAPRLPGVYGRLVRSASLMELCESGEYAPCHPMSAAVSTWAKSAAIGRMLDAESVRSRGLRALLRGAEVPAEARTKQAGDQQSLDRLAMAFALHRVATVDAMAGQDAHEAARLGRLFVNSDSRIS